MSPARAARRRTWPWGHDGPADARKRLASPRVYQQEAQKDHLMNRVLFGILAAAGSVAITGSVQGTVLFQDNFESGTSLTHEYQVIPNPIGTAVSSSNLLDSGNSLYLSGPGTSWSNYFASPYTLQAGDVVTTLVRVQIGTNRTSRVITDQIDVVLRGTDTSNAGRHYEFSLNDNTYPFMISNNSTSGHYVSGYPAWDASLGGTSPTADCWLKMVYDESSHTLTNSFATAADPSTWHQFSSDNTLTMASFTGIAVIAGDYNTLGTSQSIDSLSVTAVSVPEPASIGLLGLAMIGLVGRRRKA